MDHAPPSRALALIAVVAILAAPAATAAPAPSLVRSVGEIFVDAQGNALGTNLMTTISESNGLISGFASVALGATLFDAIAIDGFAQAEKIQGVGSSTLLLKGNNAVVAVYDNSHAAVKVFALEPTTIRYDVADGVRAIARAESKAVVDLHANDGAYIGSIFAVGADGARVDDAVRLARGKVEANVAQGAQVVFLGMPAHLSSESFQRSIVSAAAQGNLASTFVTELDGSAVAASQIGYATGALSLTNADVRGVIESSVQSPGDDALVLAYDLAYETLPARSSADVAVFANGELATRASSAAEVLANARSGIASYHAVVEGGRAQLLASTERFTAGEQRVVITVGAGAQTEAQARAESRAGTGSRIHGGFEHHGNGKLTGDFVTAIVPPGSADLQGYTSLSSGIEIFRSLRIAGNGESSLAALGEHRFRIDGSRADVTLTDDVHATMLIDASRVSDATFELASGITADQASPDVVRIHGPRGEVGLLLVAETSGAPRTDTSLHIEDGKVLAHLEEGSRIVFRAASGKFRSDLAVADAIARGELGAQLLAGVQGAGIATSGFDYFGGVAAEITSAAQGRLQASYASDIAAARSFVLDTRGTALAAKTAADVRVLVDGVAAVPVATPQAALAPAEYAKAFVETGADGSLRILVNTAMQPGGVARVLVTSAIEDAARSSASADAFGAFKLFPDGTAVGSFVTLRGVKDAAAVSDFTMMATGQPVFASIVAGATPFASRGVDGAATLVLENAETRLEAADTTSAFLRLVAKEDATAVLRLAPGLVANARSASVIELHDAKGVHVGSLLAHGEGKLSIDGADRIVATLEEGAQTIFRAHVGIEKELSQAQRTMINGAIASGRVAGHVMVQTQPALSAIASRAAADAHGRLEATLRDANDAGSVAIAASEAHGRVTAAVTTAYSSDVQMLTAATRERVDVTISSTSKLGKTILVSLDAETVPALRSGQGVVLFDGIVAKQADSYADILDANDDGGVAEYLVLAGEAGTQVLVSVPHFSVHTVSLQERQVEQTPFWAYAAGFLALLAVVQTALLVRARRTQ